MQEVEDMQKLKGIMEAMKDLTTSQDTTAIIVVSVGKQKSVLIQGDPVDIMANLCSVMEHEEKSRFIIGTAVDVFRNHEDGIQPPSPKTDKGYVN
ncbi:hypothetical protein ACF3OC_07880 [Sphingobacterium cellulitidis]|uniref:hypothetical protein n=1 Tax=Sphingobacterium cellulitidis TaxID=1768011 RepID=UPI00370D6E73